MSFSGIIVDASNIRHYTSGRQVNSHVVQRLMEQKGKAFVVKEDEVGSSGTPKYHNGGSGVSSEHPESHASEESRLDKPGRSHWLALVVSWPKNGALSF